MRDRDIQIARLAYRIGRKDARRYAGRSFGKAHTDSATVDRIASMLWTAVRGCAIPSSFDDLCGHEQTKLRMVAQEALSLVGTAMNRALDEAPEDPVNFDAIVHAVDFVGENPNEKD